jgi:DNA repair protein RadC
MQPHFFSFESSELQKNETESSSHCSSVQERLVTYGSEALDTGEHLGLILGSQKQADALLKHFGSLTVLARASVQELMPFVPRSKALRLVSSLRMGAVALREERQSLTIDSPLSIADLCSEMRFLDRECLRVVLLNAKQHLIKICTVSQGSVNEALGHPREIFKPVITHSAYSFILVHSHPSGDPAPSDGYAAHQENPRSQQNPAASIDRPCDYRLTGPGPEQLFQFQGNRRHWMTPFGPRSAHWLKQQS